MTTRGGAEVRQPAAQRRRRADQVADGERGQHHPRLEHLGLEAEADPDARHEQRPEPPSDDRALVGVGGQHQAHGERAVLHAVPEHRGGDRGQGEDRGGQQAGDHPGPAAHHPVHDEDGDDALDHLREGHRPGVEAEDPGRQRLRQERAGQLVDGDRAGRVERAVEEGLPAFRHALDRDGVERREPGLGDVPRVKRRRQRRDGQQRRAGPAAAGRRASATAPSAGAGVPAREGSRAPRGQAGPRRVWTRDETSWGAGR